jgi:hypothetical protein
MDPVLTLGVISVVFGGGIAIALVKGVYWVVASIQSLQRHQAADTAASNAVVEKLFQRHEKLEDRLDFTEKEIVKIKAKTGINGDHK